MTETVNIDLYIDAMPCSSQELAAKGMDARTIQRVERLRELAAFWRQNPTTTSSGMVQRVMTEFGMSQSTAFDDVHLLRLLIGNLEATTKEFARWKLNEMLERDMESAREAEDWRALASMQKNWIMNNQTDKEDTPDKAFDKIKPIHLIPSDDPSDAGIHLAKDHRRLRDKVMRQFDKEVTVYTPYVELPAEDAEPGEEGQAHG